MIGALLILAGLWLLLPPASLIAAGMMLCSITILKEMRHGRTD